MTQTSIPSPISPERIRIAFATDDVQQVNRCFATASTFAVFEVGPRRAELVEALAFPEPVHTTIADALRTKIERLSGCAAIYCEEVHDSVQTALAASGIRAVEVARGMPISELILAHQDAF